MTKRLLKTWATGLMVGLFSFAATSARANELACDQLVNDQAVHVATSYPASLEYALTVRNVHPTSASEVLVATDPLLLSQFKQDFTPAAPFSVPFGGSVLDVINVTLDSYEKCLAIASSDGRVDDFIDNVFQVTWVSGETQCRARVKCQNPNTCLPTGATRTPGYYQNHSGALTACLSAMGSINLGFITVSTLAAAEGILFADSAIYVNSSPRSLIDQNRLFLGQQLLAGLCNQAVIGTPPVPSSLFTDARNALSGTNCNNMTSLLPKVTAFNLAGDGLPLPIGVGPFPHDAPNGKNVGVDPTSLSGDSCSP